MSAECAPRDQENTSRPAAGAPKTPFKSRAGAGAGCAPVAAPTPPAAPLAGAGAAVAVQSARSAGHTAAVKPRGGKAGSAGTAAVEALLASVPTALKRDHPDQTTALQAFVAALAAAQGANAATVTNERKVHAAARVRWSFEDMSTIDPAPSPLADSSVVPPGSTAKHVETMVKLLVCVVQRADRLRRATRHCCPFRKSDASMADAHLACNCVTAAGADRRCVLGVVLEQLLDSHPQSFAAGCLRDVSSGKLPVLDVLGRYMSSLLRYDARQTINPLFSPPEGESDSEDEEADAPFFIDGRRCVIEYNPYDGAFMCHQALRARSACMEGVCKLLGIAPLGVPRRFLPPSVAVDAVHSSGAEELQQFHAFAESHAFLVSLLAQNDIRDVVKATLTPHVKLLRGLQGDLQDAMEWLPLADPDAFLRRLRAEAAVVAVVAAAVRHRAAQLAAAVPGSAAKGRRRKLKSKKGSRNPDDLQLLDGTFFPRVTVEDVEDDEAPALSEADTACFACSKRVDVSAADGQALLCHTCNVWGHAACVGLSTRAAGMVMGYTCPRCAGAE